MGTDGLAALGAWTLLTLAAVGLIAFGACAIVGTHVVRRRYTVGSALEEEHEKFMAIVHERRETP